MENIDIREIAERVIRTSHRFKNAGRLNLYRKGLRIARQIKCAIDITEALNLEKQYITIVKEMYSIIFPLGIPSEKGLFSVSGYADPAKNLKDAADSAYNGFEDNCSGSVADVASRLGYDELNDKNAKEQVSYMKDNWEPVDAKQAQDLANKVELVVAGLINPDGDSHVATVVPGDGKVAPDGNFYPLVQGGGSQKGRSDGTRTAGEVWPADPKKYPEYNRTLVKYYTPKKK